MSCDYNNDAECAQLYQGEAYYIALLTASGIVIGTLRWLSKYPFNLPGIFKEINSCHVDPSHSPYTYILSALSLGAGIPLGPEAALGNMGGGMGDWLTRRINFHGEDNNKLMVLSGMSAALGSLFPSPVLSAMMIHELGNPPK